MTGIKFTEWQREMQEESERKESEHNEKKNPFFSINPKVGRRCNCGGNFILRKNHKNGEYFYGCNKYPNCKRTHQIILEDTYLEVELEPFLAKTKAGKDIPDKADIEKCYQNYLLEKQQMAHQKKSEKSNIRVEINIDSNDESDDVEDANDVIN